MAHGRPAVERWLWLSGLVPLPAFLVLHLGRELGLSLASDVSELVRPAPSLLGNLSAALLIWLPLATHALLGTWLLMTGRSTTPAAADDVQPLLLRISRLTGGLALLFVAYHVRQYPIAVWLSEADARDSGFRLVASLSATHFGVPLRGGVYLLGLAATVTHAGLAVHRALLRHGLLATAERRRTSERACALGAAVLFVLGAAAVIRVASGVFLN